MPTTSDDDSSHVEDTTHDDVGFAPPVDSEPVRTSIYSPRHCPRPPPPELVEKLRLRFSSGSKVPTRPSTATSADTATHQRACQPGDHAFGVVTANARPMSVAPVPSPPASFNLGIPGIDLIPSELRRRNKVIPQNVKWDKHGRRHVVKPPQRKPNALDGSAAAPGGVSSSVKGVDDQRPTTAPTTAGGPTDGDAGRDKIELPTYKGREHFALVQQLRNSILEASEAPPAGTDPKELETRRTLLKRILADVEQEGRFTAFKNHELNAARRTRCALEEDARMKGVVLKGQMKYMHFRMAHEDMAEERDSRYSDRVDRDRRKAAECREYLNTESLNNFERLVEETARVDQQYASIKKQRELDANALRERKALQQRHADDVRTRKEQEEEDEYQHGIETARLVAKDRASREAIRQEQLNLKREAAKCTQRRRQSGGPNMKTRVLMRGAGETPTLVRIERNHEERLRELERVDKEQRDRYADEKDLKDAYAALLRAKRDKRLNRQHDNYIRIQDQKLTKYEAILDEDKRKARHVAQQRRETERAMWEERKALDSDIREHQRRADEIQFLHNDDTALDQGTRWRRRGEHALNEITSRYGHLRSVEEYDRQTGNRSRGTSLGGDSSSHHRPSTAGSITRNASTHL